VRALLPLLAVPILAAACGGSGSASGTTTAATTTTAASETEFVSAGNKICMSSDKRIFKIGRLTRDPKGWALTATSAKRAVREMRALKPPAGKARAFNLMMRYANALSLTIQEVHGFLVQKNIDAAAQATLAGGRLQNKVHEYAKAAGLTFCQQALTNWPA
jgi:hypothetical protein